MRIDLGRGASRGGLGSVGSFQVDSSKRKSILDFEPQITQYGKRQEAISSLGKGMAARNVEHKIYAPERKRQKAAWESSERKFKAEVSKPGTISHSLSEIKNRAGSDWLNELETKQAIYGYLHMKTELGQPVGAQELKALIGAAKSGDVRLVRSFLATHATTKKAKAGADPAKHLGLGFRLIDILAEESRGMATVDMLHGQGAISIKEAKRRIEKATGQTWKEFVLQNAPNLKEQFKGEKIRSLELLKALEARESEGARFLSDTSYLQFIAKHIKETPGKLAGLVVDNAAFIAAANAAVERGVSIDEVMNDRELLDTIERAKAHTEILINVAAGFAKPLQAAMYVKDYIAPLAERLGAEMSTGAARKEGIRNFNEFIDGFDPTKSGGWAVMNGLGFLGDTMSMSVRGTSKAAKSFSAIAKAGKGLRGVDKYKALVDRKNLAKFFNNENFESMTPSGPFGKLNLDGDALGRLYKSARAGKIDWGSAQSIVSAAMKAGIRESDAGAAGLRAIQSQKFLERDGTSGAFPEFRTAGKAAPEDLRQFEDHIDMDRQDSKSAREVARTVEGIANERPLFDRPISKVSNDEFVATVSRELTKEARVFFEASGTKSGFYDRDVLLGRQAIAKIFNC